ncbi:single-stranded DNA-binding protein [Leuconostoc lactis]|uniref:single-stranded DNA-binding protein n=1 Tax=Leuconostoc lactis TaxID=1246 RepID=UPI00101EB249|nr:single-stranded DNA-binding protein [Leuconostoc lactis]MSB65612.1 single-stranded DNA-binding protein [Leuconostoc lactis]RYS84923.1 single-stranded DNA-binding protein [Leuconostoc lactis]
MQINHHVGRLVRDVKFSVRGAKQTKIAYFTLAINDLKDGKATYINYVAFNKTAELIRDFVKTIGQVVEVEFLMRNTTYTDKDSGKKIYTLQNQVTQFRIYKSSKAKKITQEQHELPAENVNLNTDDNVPSYPDFNMDTFDYVEG